MLKMKGAKMNFNYQLGRTPIFLRREVEKAEQMEEQQKAQGNDKPAETEETPEQPAANNALSEYVDSMETYNQPQASGNVTSEGTVDEADEKNSAEYQGGVVNNEAESELPDEADTMHRDFVLKNMGFSEAEIDQYFDKVETSKQGQLGGTYYVLRSDLQISVTNDEGITSLKTITSAEELKECLDNKKEVGTSLPENLTEAINTGDTRAIISELAAMDIPYDIATDSGKAQVYEVVTFNYEGKDYEIHCKDTNIEMQTQTIDTSVEGQLKSIVKALENGGRQKLEQLDELGIEYDIKEDANGGYTVKFSYEGVDYEATYTPVETQESESEPIDPAFMNFFADFINANINATHDRFN